MGSEWGEVERVSVLQTSDSDAIMKTQGLHPGLGDAGPVALAPSTWKDFLFLKSIGSISTEFVRSEGLKAWHRNA